MTPERSAAADTPAETRLATALVLLAPAFAAIFLQVGWGRWADVLVDFGRELYVPWRLVEGDVLYRDIAWFSGPLSQYVNALLLELFGVGFWTIAWANIVVLALFCVLLLRFLCAISTRLAGAAGLLFFLAVFACGQQVPIGNYNFISPYSHEATHGLVLAFASLACIVRHRVTERRRWLVVAGACLGLVLLTKVEVSVAAVIGVFATLSLSSAATHSGRELSSRAAIVGLSALIGPVAFVVALSRAMPVGDAITGTFGAWSRVFDDSVSELAYYRHGMGFDDPIGNLRRMGVSFGVMLLAFGPGFLASRYLVAPRSTRRAALVGAGVFALAFVAWRLSASEWRWLARGVTLALALIVSIGLLAFARMRDDALRVAWAEFLGFSMFAFALLAKMLLQVRFGHYGFVLAAPATLALLTFVVGWLPRFIERARGGREGRSRVWVIAGALGMYTACGLALWGKSSLLFAPKRVPVGSGADRFLADVRGPFVNDTLVEVKSRLAEGDTLLVLPEGVTINYLARVRSPTRYLNFMPPELILFGESEIVAELESNPPGSVVLVHKDTSEYGFPFFGRDYGEELADWVLARYRQVWTHPRGGVPLEPGTSFGISLLEPAE